MMVTKVLAEGKESKRVSPRKYYLYACLAHCLRFHLEYLAYLPI